MQKLKLNLKKYQINESLDNVIVCVYKYRHCLLDRVEDAAMKWQWRCILSELCLDVVGAHNNWAKVGLDVLVSIEIGPAWKS